MSMSDKVLILADEGFHELELFYPWYRFQEEGKDVNIDDYRIRFGPDYQISSVLNLSARAGCNYTKTFADYPDGSKSQSKTEGFGHIGLTYLYVKGSLSANYNRGFQRNRHQCRCFCPYKHTPDHQDRICAGSFLPLKEECRLHPLLCHNYKQRS